MILLTFKFRYIQWDVHYTRDASFAQTSMTSSPPQNLSTYSPFPKHKLHELYKPGVIYFLFFTLVCVFQLVCDIYHNVPFSMVFEWYCLFEGNHFLSTKLSKLMTQLINSVRLHSLILKSMCQLPIRLWCFWTAPIKGFGLIKHFFSYFTRHFVEVQYKQNCWNDLVL